ncbi:MAG: hypothetical protein DME55_06120 [Verrucomicrobia bacterium]|nr:MAG: hypothetical protein DME55_06120 [Verrucomicrobiota bacterium]
MSELNQLRVVFLLSLSLFFCAERVGAQQTPATASSPNASPTSTPAVFSVQILGELKRLQQAALTSDYAFRQVAHLSNNIGPRLSGSAQAAKAVEYVAGELKALGCEVHLEKVMVPHWVRGEETAALVQLPGQAENTTQKIVLCALGGSVATAPQGIEADVLVARNFDELLRKVVVAKHTVKQSFTVARVQAKPRDRARSRV